MSLTAVVTVKACWRGGEQSESVLRFGNDAKTDRTLRARFRESASYGCALKARKRLDDPEPRSAYQA